MGPSCQTFSGHSPDIPRTFPGHPRTSPNIPEHAQTSPDDVRGCPGMSGDVRECPGNVRDFRGAEAESTLRRQQRGPSSCTPLPLLAAMVATEDGTAGDRGTGDMHPAEGAGPHGLCGVQHDQGPGPAGHPRPLPGHQAALLQDLGQGDCGSLGPRGACGFFQRAGEARAAKRGPAKEVRGVLKHSFVKSHEKRLSTVNAGTYQPMCWWEKQFLVTPRWSASAGQLRVFARGPRVDTLLLMADPPLNRSRYEPKNKSKKT